MVRRCPTPGLGGGWVRAAATPPSVSIATAFVVTAGTAAAALEGGADDDVASFSRFLFFVQKQKSHLLHVAEALFCLLKHFGHCFVVSFTGNSLLHDAHVRCTVRRFGGFSALQCVHVFFPRMLRASDYYWWLRGDPDGGGGDRVKRGLPLKKKKEES